MASLTRLLFSISSEDNEIKSTEVFDVTKSQLKASVSALTTTRQALDVLKESKMPKNVICAMKKWLASCNIGNFQSCKDVHLAEWDVIIHKARECKSPKCLLQMGLGSLCLNDICLKTPLRTLRAQTIVDGLTFNLVALVRNVTLPIQSSLHKNPLVGNFHFIGLQGTDLCLLEALNIGKRSSVVMTHGFNSSYFSRREQQKKEHMAAMQNLGLSAAAPQPLHRMLFDAYESYVQHQDKQMHCVSVFI